MQYSVSHRSLLTALPIAYSYLYVGPEMYRYLTTYTSLYLNKEFRRIDLTGNYSLANNY